MSPRAKLAIAFLLLSTCNKVAFAQVFEQPGGRECPPTRPGCSCYDGQLNCVATNRIQREGNLISFPLEGSITPNALFDLGKIAGPGARIQTDINDKSAAESKILLSKESAESFKKKLNIQQPLPK